MITGRKEVLLANELNKCASLIVKPLQALGWLEIGQIPTGECFRLTGFPPRSGTGDELPFYVQPDLEVLVPFTFPYTKRYQLAKFADFMGGDQYLHYEINEGSIRRACQLGQSLPEIIHLLVEWSCFPLPEIVQQQIENWAGQFQGVLLEPVVLVHTRDESLADKLQDTALGQSWKVDRRGPSCLSVSPSSLGQVKEWLKKEGKRVSAIREPLVKEGDKDLSGPEYWSQRLHVLHKAELDNHYPEMTEAWPGAKNIPKLWTSGLRSYHPSMQQELLRRSIEEQLDVRLEWKGQFLTVTPHQLKREGGECFLEGWGPEGRKRRLSLNEITRLQIFIPQPEPGHH
nr:helicase-associated domain-containing protein [Paenactinomyces guangxiensis]